MLVVFDFSSTARVGVFSLSILYHYTYTGSRGGDDYLILGTLNVKHSKTDARVQYRVNYVPINMHHDNFLSVNIIILNCSATEINEPENARRSERDYTMAGIA